MTIRHIFVRVSQSMKLPGEVLSDYVYAISYMFSVYRALCSQFTMHYVHSLYGSMFTMIYVYKALCSQFIMLYVYKALCSQFIMLYVYKALGLL